MPDQQTNLGGAPVTMGPVGYWLDSEGRVAATDPQGNRQQTPGQRDNPQSAIYYDSAKDLDYNLVNGHKVYQSPVAFDGTKTVYKQSKNGPPISDTGGGLVHGRPQWNPQEGKWDVNLDFGKILAWAAAAGISAGAITAAMPAGATVAGTTGGAATGTGGVALTGGAATTGASAFTGAGVVHAGLTAAAATAAKYGVDYIASRFNQGSGETPTEDPSSGGAPQGPDQGSGEGYPLGNNNSQQSGGSSLLNWLIPTTVSVAGQLFGAKVSSNASVEAEKLRQASIMEALKFEKQRYNDLQGRLSPYVAVGSTSADRMAQLLGLPPRQGAGQVPPPPTPLTTQPAAPPVRSTTLPTGPPQPGPGGSTAPPPDQTAGQTVLMRSPDGKETQPVPLADVPHWKSLGAVPVGNA